tara:strand:+ start:361 stop:777 length:417 start_codon:yes stop_codon:yes gene_type:complete
VAARQSWVCACGCERLLDEAFELDHVRALHDGGGNGLENAQALRSDCHNAKTTRERCRWARERREAIERAKTEAEEAVEQQARDDPLGAGVRLQRQREKKRKREQRLPALGVAEEAFLASKLLRFAFAGSRGRPALVS